MEALFSTSALKNTWKGYVQAMNDD
jgi:hypothetical protein